MAEPSIPGWFSFQEWYEDLAKMAPPGATLVELGVFCGKSLAFMAKEVRGKGCRVIGVDNFLGSPEFGDQVRLANGSRWEDAPTGVLAGMAISHLHAAGVLNDATLIVSDSAKAADLFADRSVWSVFVDAGHDADSVERDVRAWLPKVISGGWISGDDYDEGFPGVREGLSRVFAESLLPPLPPNGVSTSWRIQVD